MCILGEFFRDCLITQLPHENDFCNTLTSKMIIEFTQSFAMGAYLAFTAYQVISVMLYRCEH